MSTTEHDTRTDAAQQEIDLMRPMAEATLSGTLTPVDQDHRPRSGPNTPAGKAAVAGNAITSGIFAKTHVLPGVERAEDWEAHLAGMLASLEPADYLETLLAVRAAEISWAQQRLCRYEAALLRLNQPERQQEVTRLLPNRAKHEELGGWSDLDSLEEHIQAVIQLQESLEQLASAKTMLPREAVHRWLNLLIFDEGLEPVDVPRKVEKLLRSTRDPIPAAAVFRAVKVLAAAIGKTLPAMLRTASEVGKTREATLRKLKAWVHTEQQLLEPLQLLPRPEELQLLMRYRAQLSRHFHQTLHELEARQARRRGEATPLVRVDISGSPEADAVTTGGRLA